MLYFFLASTALLAYVIVGYPLLLQLIVRLRGARPFRRSADAGESRVIPARTKPTTAEDR
jgi:hypothetical protein